MTSREAIISEASKGKRPAIIAEDLCLPISTVYSVISKARQSGAPIPHFSTGRTRPLGETQLPRQELRFYLDPETAATLSAEAARRGLHPSRFARNLITAICDDAIFSAVLED